MKLVKRLFAVTAATILCTTAVYADKPKEINFGILSTESTQNLKQDWQPMIEDMQKRTGLKVNAFFAPDYAGIIEGMRFNKVQVAWMGNKSAMDAVERANGEVFAQVIQYDGTLGYYSYLSVHKDSPYQTLDDVLKAGKSIHFGIGDPNSTSGFLVPSYYVFAVRNIDPRTHFKTVRNANHETNILSVANKQLDAGVHSSDVLDRISKRAPETAAKLRQVWKSPLIPSDPLVWRNDLDSETKRRVLAFLLEYGQKGSDTAREQAVLNKLTFAGFKASSNEQLNPIRQLELFRARTKIESDSTLNAADKKQKIDEINQKLDELNKKLAALK